MLTDLSIDNMENRRGMQHCATQLAYARFWCSRDAHMSHSNSHAPRKSYDSKVTYRINSPWDTSPCTLSSNRLPTVQRYLNKSCNEIWRRVRSDLYDITWCTKNDSEITVSVTPHIPSVSHLHSTTSQTTRMVRCKGFCETSKDSW